MSLVKKLQQLHDKHLTRPDFDENSSEEKEIESITKDITSVGHRLFNYLLTLMLSAYIEMTRS
jgi:hypothetical protein